ncbi:MAG: hypothetical protein ACT4PO_15295 [Actinomycetota bacterium]
MVRSRRPSFAGLALLVVALTVLTAPLAALAQEAGPSVSGSVSGSLAQGGRLTVRVSAAYPVGWGNLHELAVDLIVGGSVAEHIGFDIEDNLLEIGPQTVPVGTGAIGNGSYLQIRGSDVIVTTGGARLELTLKLLVLKAIPADARFRIQAVDDFDAAATITRRLVSREADEGGFTWGTIVTAVAVALFAGGFVGSVFASRRRPPTKLSIYSTVQRRLDEERAAKGSAEPADASRPAP